MKQILETIDTWGVRVMIIMVVIIFFRTCRLNGRIDKLDKNLISTSDTINGKIDRVDSTIRREIKIEGLRSEKRMIQSTDRKIFDLNRQTEIDKEINELSK